MSACRVWKVYNQGDYTGPVTPFRASFNSPAIATQSWSEDHRRPSLPASPPSSAGGMAGSTLG